MCGIAGFQGWVDGALADEMGRRIAHRGPDGSGIKELAAAGTTPSTLIHRRLAIIDLSINGLQPMQLRESQSNENVTIVFNGEIYNYRELRSELEKKGHTFRSESDTEVLLKLYVQDGLAMLDRLNGIFAFAIHDGRSSGLPSGMERGSLFIARDQLGVKPLYYCSSSKGFLFASEIKSLLCSREVRRDLDPAAIHQMLAYLWTPAPSTVLADVRKLEPGTALIVTNQKISRHFRYYRLPYGRVNNGLTMQQATEELVDKLRLAVKRQLVADVAVGAFLSGGLDSSAIVAMARELNPGSAFTCFTASVESESDLDGNPDDLPYARSVARHLGVDLEEVKVAPDAIKRLPEMVWLLDEPQADPAPINALLIAERSRAMGIPVLLSGAGGDDIFSGYRRHWALQFERNWTWLPRLVRSGLQGFSSRAAEGSAFGQSNTFVRRLSKMFSYAAEPDARRLASYFWWSTEGLRRGLYSPDFAGQVRDEDVATPLLNSLSEISDERDPLQRMLFLETRHFLADHNLNYTDRSGMAVGVEVRTPLLDIDIVQFAATIPAHLKQQGTIGKSVFKHAMAGHLPKDVIWRPKTGFGAPLRKWLQGELREQMEDLLSESSIRNRGLFEPRAVRNLAEMDRSGRVDGAYTLFALMCLELWFRSFVDRNGEIS